MQKQLLTGLMILGLACPSWATGDGEKDSVAVQIAATITADDLLRHLEIIASDAYEGRETGEEGQKRAAQYIADHFQSLGLEPVINGSYFQEFPLEILDPRGAYISIDKTRYQFLRDFYYYSGFEDQVLEGQEFVFAGHGIADADYNDYTGLDVAGKVVVILDKEPYGKDGLSKLTDKKRPSEWSLNYRKKIDAAIERDAAALLVVVENIDKKIGRLRRYLSKPGMRLAENAEDTGMPILYVSEQMANDLMGADKKKVNKLKSRIAKKMEPLSFKGTTPVTVNVTRDRKEFTSENVLGYIEGSDLKDELVIITAHYDHVGRDGDSIYNGADDDGSGTVAVLELAEAFVEAKKAGHGPRRSVLIMPVSGEEKGLLGSEWYSSHPVFPLENTVVDLNIDMIGRVDDKHEGDPDYIYLIGSDRLSTTLHAVSEKANETYTNLALDYTYNAKDDPQQFYYRSDHYNFAKHNIPVIFYFNGTHKDYHKPTDTVDKINFDKMEKITRLVFHTAWEVANADERPAVDVVEEEN